MRENKYIENYVDRILYYRIPVRNLSNFDGLMCLSALEAIIGNKRKKKIKKSKNL